MGQRRQRLGDAAAGNAGPPGAGGGGKDPPLSLQRERSPAETSILDFRPPELWESRFLLF